MYFRKASQYLAQELDIKMPEGEVSGTWFVENNLPMVVRCSDCGSTMALPSALIDEDGDIFCSSCVESY